MMLCMCYFSRVYNKKISVKIKVYLFSQDNTDLRFGQDINFYSFLINLTKWQPWQIIANYKIIITISWLRIKKVESLVWRNSLILGVNSFCKVLPDEKISYDRHSPVYATGQLQKLLLSVQTFFCKNVMLFASIS